MEHAILKSYNINMKKILTLILGISTLIGFTMWAVNYMSNPTPDNAAKIAPVIVQAAIPWWIPVIQFLTTWGLIGGLLIVGLLLISKNKLPS